MTPSDLAPIALALLIFAALVAIIARAVREAATDTPRTPGGDDSVNGMYK